MEKVKITDREVFKYKLTVLTGIHIGGNMDSYGIGGVDSPVIKNPLTNQPIIPGSSIKGKIRFLLDAKGKSHDLIIKSFGKEFGVKKDKNNNNNNYNYNNNGYNNNEYPLSRFIFRDLKLNDESAERLESILGTGFFTEIKAENNIDKNGKAQPRFIERVPATAVFEGEVIIQAINGENIDQYISLLEDGFELLEGNYLGGNGSRGYGKVKIERLKNE